MKTIKTGAFVNIVGLLSLFYWFLDVVNNIYILHNPAWVLWYSSLGLAFTSLALITRNAFLLNSMFCALFVAESIWLAGYMSLLLFKKGFLDVASYAFSPTFPMKDYIITLYHLCIAPALVVGMISMRKAYSYAWIGASLYAGALAFTTYVFVDPSNGVNCIHTIYYCKGVMGFLSGMDTPFRVIVGYILFVILFFIPTNYLLIKSAQVFGWKTESFDGHKTKKLFSPLLGLLFQK